MIQSCPAAARAVNSADACKARGVSYLSMITSTNCIFRALANSSSSRSLSSSDLLRTVYDRVSLPSISPRVVRSEAHFLSQGMFEKNTDEENETSYQSAMSLYFLQGIVNCHVVCLINDHSPIEAVQMPLNVVALVIQHKDYRRQLVMSHG